MKTIIALALLAIATNAQAAPTVCQGIRIPDVIGMDYHLARVKLLKAGFRPRQTGDFPRSMISDALEIGYFESHLTGQGSAGIRGWQWDVFYVVTKRCEFLFTYKPIDCPVIETGCGSVEGGH